MALPKVTDLYEVGTTEIWVLTLILCSYNYVTMSDNLHNLNLDDLKIYSIWTGEKMGDGHHYKYQLLLNYLENVIFLLFGV